NYIRTLVQDGYGQGELTGTTFNDRGELVGSYDNGKTMTLFKVPVATFVSENNLEAISGNLFHRSEAAGDVSVWAAEDVPGGRTAIAPQSVENSTVDIEDEFTKMIMTQKAYSSNATVFKTADEMTTVARDLK
ncbi:MAG: flagellar hook-basal body complex protein, partial [Magnetospirillum sp.]|nr:flagellar hook-basal body complex protein [Magnetospirillum sp.]